MHVRGAGLEKCSLRCDEKTVGDWEVGDWEGEREIERERKDDVNEIKWKVK